jgi:glycosyltransferase involved in cell wall biosynthesis
MATYSSSKRRWKTEPFVLDQGRKPKVAIIVPAFNEAARIGRVLRAASASKYADEVIVVADGCTDGTAAVAGKYPGVRVVDLPFNVGKAGAMSAGVKATDAAVLMFVDADLDGLSPDHLDSIIRPILFNQCEMCIGVFRGGKFWSDAAQRVTPYYSGQRALVRKLFTGVPNIEEARMGVEIALNEYAKRMRARVLRVVLFGVSNCHKEQKMGLAKGIQARSKMFQEMIEAKKRAMKRRRRDRWRDRSNTWPWT